MRNYHKQLKKEAAQKMAHAQKALQTAEEAQAAANQLRAPPSESEDDSPSDQGESSDESSPSPPPKKMAKGRDNQWPDWCKKNGFKRIAERFPLCSSVSSASTKHPRWRESSASSSGRAASSSGRAVQLTPRES